MSVDMKHKLVRVFSVTPASVHDGQVFEDLLRENTGQDVWVDAVYGKQEEQLKGLLAAGYRMRISAWVKGIIRSLPGRSREIGRGRVSAVV